MAETRDFLRADTLKENLFKKIPQVWVRIPPHLPFKFMKIQLTKIDTVENPLVESASSIDEYGKSVWNSIFKNTHTEDHLSPPIEYSITGELINDIEVGKSIKVNRESRNGVMVPGLFYTSPVVTIGFKDNKIVGFTTKNSLYKIDYLD